MTTPSDDADIVDLLRDLVYGEHINCKAADIIESLREQMRIADRNYWDRGRELQALKEKLAFKETECKDVEEFRQRERKHAEAVMIGMRLAIESMVSGMKGGGK